MKKSSEIIILLFLSFILLISLTEAEALNNTKISKKVLTELDSGKPVKVIIQINNSNLQLKTNSKSGSVQSVEPYKNYKLLTISKRDLQIINNNYSIAKVFYDYPLKPLLLNSTKIINANSTWSLKINSLNLTGQNVSVCIIDTGLNYSHPDLSSNYLIGYDFGNRDADPSDYNGHGTHVAGIVAANGNIKGVAPGVNLLIAKVFRDDGSASTSDLIDAINWCADQNAKIITISLALCEDQYCNNMVLRNSSCDDEFSDLADPINAAVAKNISVTIAAGNEHNYTNIGAPACISQAIPVSATTNADIIDTSYSNRNSLVKLLAPGTSINSTEYSGANICSEPGVSCNGNYATMSGTSMATPHVAGAIALINQYLSSVGKTETPSEIEQTLYNTGKKVNDSGYSNLNYSRINVYDAIISLDSDLPVVNLNSLNNISYSNVINQTFSCNATDLSLKNMTFYLWNSTSLINTTNRNITGGTDSFETNLTNLVYTNYTWNCYYYDENGNVGVSSNYTLVIVPSITINIPVNNSWNNGNFSINISEQGNCSYSLNNSANVSMNTSDNFSFSALNQTLIQNFYYYITFYCQGLVGNSNSSLYSFYYDAEIPVVNITGDLPSNETSNSIDKKFYYNVSDNLDISKCELVINDTIVETNSSIITNETNNFSYTFTPGTYNYSVNCTDEAGNIGNSSSGRFTITAPAVQTHSGSSGGGGGGAAPAQAVILSTDIEKGITKEIAQYGRVKFELNSAGKRENHSIVLNKVVDNSVNVTISSDPINLLLNVGEEKKINLTNSEYYDLTIRLEGINNVTKKANIALKSIYEEINPTSNKSIVTKSQNNLKTESPIADSQKDNSRYYICAVVLVFVMLLIVAIKRKKKVVVGQKKRIHSIKR